MILIHLEQPTMTAFLTLQTIVALVVALDTTPLNPAEHGALMTLYNDLKCTGIKCLRFNVTDVPSELVGFSRLPQWFCL